MEGLDLDRFYLEKKEPFRSCLLALRQIILDSDPDIRETRKYGMPCFCLGKRHFCCLWTDKKLHILALKANLGLDHIERLYAEGMLAPSIDGPYPLEEAPRLMSYFGKAEHHGKVVIQMDD